MTIATKLALAAAQRLVEAGGRGAMHMPVKSTHCVPLGTGGVQAGIVENAAFDAGLRGVADDVVTRRDPAQTPISARSPTHTGR